MSHISPAIRPRSHRRAFSFQESHAIVGVPRSHKKKQAEAFTQARSYHPFPGWAYHEVVVKDGRVYDAFTGHQGLPIAEYKALWDTPMLLTSVSRPHLMGG